MKDEKRVYYNNAIDMTNVFCNCNKVKKSPSCSKIYPCVISITINHINIFKYPYKCITYH